MNHATEDDPGPDQPTLSLKERLLSRGDDWGFQPQKWVAALSVVLVALVHVHAAWGGRGPVIVPDETGNLGNAHVLSGVGPTWTLAGSGYMPGLGILITPFWWLTENPMFVFYGGLAIVVVLSVLLVWPLARIAQYFGATSTGGVVIASVIAIAPARTIQSNYVIAESLVALTTACVVVGAIGVHRRPTSVGYAVGFGLVATLPFLAHGRGLAITVAASLWMLWRVRINWRASAFSIVSMGLFSILWYGLYSGIVGSLYWSDDRVGTSLQGLRGTATEMLANIGGLGWYAVAAWPAMFVVAFIYLAYRSRRNSIAQFLIIATAGAVAMAVVALSDPGSTMLRIDSYVYGRYIENVLIVLATIGLSVLVRVRSALLMLLSTAGVLVAVAAFSVLTVPIIPLGGTWSDLHIAGVSHYFSRYNFANDLPEPWLLFSFFTVVLTVGLLVLSRYRGVVIWVVGVYFLALSIANDEMRLDPWDDRLRSTDSIQQAAVALDPTIPIYFDGNYGRFINLHHFALSPQEVRVEFPDSLPDDVVYFYTDSGAMEPFESGALPVEILDATGLAIWVYPGPEQDRLSELDLLAEVTEEGMELIVDD